jgi:hypothetical protein
MVRAIRTHALALPAVLMLFSYSPATAQDGLTLFHKMQAALGGADKIAGIRDFEEQVQAKIFDSKGKSLGEVRKRTRWIRPNYLRVDQIGPFDTYALYFDGSSGWEILPDKSAKELVGSELKFAQGYLRNFDLNVWLADRDPRYQVTSSEPNAVHIVRVDDATDTMDIFLDPGTGLPLRNGSLSPPDAAHPATSGMLFEEWTAVKGVRFPTRRANFHNGARLAEGTTDFLAVNTDLKPAELAVKPADLNPVLRQLPSK